MLSIAVLCGLLWLVPQAYGRGDPTVTLADGSTLVGNKVGNVAQFRGIRYAAPPVGSLRWVPPQPYVNPDPKATVNATAYGGVCTQQNWGGGSEDCLFLNVYVFEDKLDSANAELPVAFFIHGGAYQDGCSNLYDGTEIVDYWKGSAIVVTINYRLGVFGFMGSDEMRVLDGEFGSTGNYGLQDQRMALQWVQENIAAFGGDKTRVMIYGESAGAASVTNHLTMPKSAAGNLYSSAIIESGAFSEWAIQNFTLSQNAYERFLAETGCEDVECLKIMDTASLFEASRNIKSLDKNYLYPWNPAPDNVEIFTHPWLVLNEGGVKDVLIMMGSNNDEGTMFTILPRNATEAQLIAHWTREYYSADDQAIMMQMYVTDATYPDVEGDSVYWWAGQRQLG